VPLLIELHELLGTLCRAPAMAHSAYCDTLSAKAASALRPIFSGSSA